MLLLVGNGGVSWAEKRVPTNITALTIAGTPLWMLVLDWMRPGGRRPHGLVFAGLGLGFVGVVLIVAGRDAQGHGIMDPAGAVMLLSASPLLGRGLDLFAPCAAAHLGTAGHLHADARRWSAHAARRAFARRDTPLEFAGG